MLNWRAESWETFNQNKAKSNFPIWPNEVMVKLAFGSYLDKRIAIGPHSRVLDVGCGFGNNLLPFLTKGCVCAGTEVTTTMAQQTREILKERGFTTDIREGSNQMIPFEDNSFDMLLSINTIHYEGSFDGVQCALKEYKRVLADGGRLILMTVGPQHVIIKRAHTAGPHEYEIRDFDFRDGSRFFCFETQEYLKDCLDRVFLGTETGKVTEKLMKYDLEFLIAVAEAVK